MRESDWYGLYRERWGKEIVKDAYAHPAKYARGLIRRIYAHLFEMGYLRPGDSVADPFGGVALGALDAMRLGCHWIGFELEAKFVDLGNQNIDRWNDRYQALWPDTWGTAVLLQGDSRELVCILRRHLEADATVLVSSPPYAQINPEKSGPGINLKKQYETYRASGGGMAYEAFCEQQKRHAEGYGSSPGQLATMRASDQGLEAVVSSPPYSQTLKGGEGPGARYDFKTHSPDNAIKQTCDPDYGADPANLANLPEGDLDAVVTSPPFGAGETRDRAPVQPGHVADCMTRSYTQDKQGTTPGNLATMDACVSSPPWEKGAEGVLRADKFKDPEAFAAAMSANDGAGTRNATTPSSRLAQMERDAGRTYGDTEGQMGQQAGDDFWTAARAIVDQCHAILKPGAVAVWVVKRFVRDKQIVDFPDQWRQMCEAAGFETVEWIRAWLVEDRGTQIDLFGNDHQHTVSRKSFFRRLYESKYPQNSIDWEDVIIMRRLPQ